MSWTKKARIFPCLGLGIAPWGCRYGVSFLLIVAVVVQLPSHVQLFATPQIVGLPSCPAPSPRVCSSSCLLNRWCHPTISSPVSLCSFLPSIVLSIRVIWLFASGGQKTGTSTSAPVLPMNIQDWFPLGLTGLIFLQSKGLSRVFSSTTVWNHQCFAFFMVHLSHGPTCTWLLERP